MTRLIIIKDFKAFYSLLFYWLLNGSQDNSIYAPVLILKLSDYSLDFLSDTFKIL